MRVRCTCSGVGVHEYTGVKGRRKDECSKVHAAQIMGMRRTEFQYKYIMQVIVSDSVENNMTETIQSNSRTGKICPIYFSICMLQLTNYS